MSSTSPIAFEVVDGLVHGLQRDRRHLGPGRLEERLDGRVRVVAVEQTEDRLALRGDPQALDPGTASVSSSTVFIDSTLSTTLSIANW